MKIFPPQTQQEEVSHDVPYSAYSYLSHVPYPLTLRTIFADHQVSFLHCTLTRPSSHDHVEKLYTSFGLSSLEIHDEIIGMRAT
jgi:hypothetical protein